MMMEANTCSTQADTPFGVQAGYGAHVGNEIPGRYCAEFTALAPVSAARLTDGYTVSGVRRRTARRRPVL